MEDIKKQVREDLESLAVQSEIDESICMRFQEVKELLCAFVDAVATLTIISGSDDAMQSRDLARKELVEIQRALKGQQRE